MLRSLLIGLDGTADSRAALELGLRVLEESRVPVFCFP